MHELFDSSVICKIIFWGVSAGLVLLLLKWGWEWLGNSQDEIARSQTPGPYDPHESKDKRSS